MSYPTENPCNDYTDCGNTTELPAGSYSSASWYHAIDLSVGSDATLYQSKVTRRFGVEYDKAQKQSISKVISYRGEITNCAGSAATGSHNSSISEDCRITKRVPYYIDRTNDIYVVREVDESLSFSVTSDKVAIFRQMYGNMAFHKLLIKKGTMVQGRETFYLIKGGVKTALASSSYTFNPFGANGPQRIYGLNGAVIEQDTRYGEPTPDVVQVIVLPPPPSMGIPLDADIAKYGFYDYLALEEGTGGAFSSLMKDDGGQDFFYPAWCRAMESDILWQETRDRRFELNYPGYKQPKPELMKGAEWTPPAPDVYPWPFGSFAVDADGNYIYSALLEFSQKAQGGKIIYHQSSIGDLKKALFTDNKITQSNNWIITPVTPP